MLCSVCNTIVLQLDADEAEIEIRRYSNPYELRSNAESCDFCSLVHEGVKELENPNTAEYCKSAWGLNFFNALLEQSSVTAHHRSFRREHNVVVGCYLDAANTSGYQQGPTALDFRKMLGGMFVHSDDTLAPYISGRPFNPRRSREEQIASAKARYDECCLKHSKCKASIDPIFMPRRVLDLDPDVFRKGSARLLIVPEGFKKPYATLSYCWGLAQNIRLTTDVLRQYCEEGIPTTQLPATIRDACEVCIDLDIRYLWVCSLCILQDSESDWRQQSSAMATIYNSSSLTLSADSGRNCHSGLFTSRSTKSPATAALKCRSAGASQGTCFVRGPIVPHGFKEPTTNRGWTLQENILSRRLLRWGTYEFSWQCATSLWNESGRYLVTAQAVEGVFPCPPLTYPLNLYKNEPTHLCEDHSSAKVWRDVVQEYSRRSLSLSKDKLPAISGLAKWLYHRFGGEERYLAGLWASELPESLLWYNKLVLPLDAAESIRPTTYRAPSWSWAALDCKYLQWLDVALGDSTARILDYDLSHKDNDPFGEVLDGSLRIEAPLTQGRLVPNATHPEHFDLWGEDWIDKPSDKKSTRSNEALGEAYLDVYDTTDTAIICKASVRDRVRACECLRVTTNAALLVRPPTGTERYGDNCAATYRQRIGMVRFYDRADEFWQNTSSEVIYLI